MCHAGQGAAGEEPLRFGRDQGEAHVSEQLEEQHAAEVGEPVGASATHSGGVPVLPRRQRGRAVAHHPGTLHHQWRTGREC